jgi:hypothetical protein
MSIDNEKLKDYWRTVSSLSDRLVAATSFMLDWAAELPAPDSGADVFKTIMDGMLAGNSGDVWKNALRPDIEPVAELPHLDGDSRFVSVNNLFVGGLKLLIEELIERVRTFAVTEHHAPVLSLLSADVHTLAWKFGSFTAAWDQLVTLKYETSVPDRRRRKFDAWFTAVVGVSERFLRDVIGVTILLAGRELAADALLACYRSQQLNVPHPSAEQLIRLPDVDIALVRSTLAFMERGPTETTEYAEEFAHALGTSLFPPGERGLRPGILSVLRQIGGTSENTWSNLLEARKAIVDETAQVLRTASKSAPREILYTLDQHQLELVAEFLCGFSFGFAMRILAAVAERAARVRPAMVTELRHRHSGELRVLVMRLLSDRRYGLAWAVAEAALDVEPAGSPGTMLKLNCLFARQRFGNGHLSRREIEQFEVGAVPKYQLFKEVLLGHLDQRALQPLLDACLVLGDLSPNELDGWPALDTLRATDWWPGWRQRH